MDYAIRHRTTYRYESDVAYSRLITHLGPRETVSQRALAFEVTVTPEPVVRFERSDFFGNTTNWFTIEEPHEVLEVVAESQVSVNAPLVFAPDASAGWESVRKALDFPTDADALQAVQYAFDTPLTATGEEVIAYAEPSFAPGRPLFESVLELNTRIYTDFKYDKKATDTRTTVEHAFELRAGVCQDFAHVGIAAVRAMGLAARYVSGYLQTQPPPGRERLIGADASHAWFSVWIPPFGWVDFDPTNDMLPGSHHITVAWGRDYVDVAPIHGIITGGSEHEVDVGVDVVPVLP
ncbi:MAG TPA: transglutaminase family protein [Candidatus Baltobacteraceae bacterium]